VRFIAHLTVAAVAAVFAFVAIGVPPAAAQNKAAAEQLFKDGRRLMKAKKYGAACKKFEASHELDAALGTLLNLATCLEKNKKIASAWARFVEASSKAKRAKQRKRYRYARKMARSLQKRVPKLKIVAPSMEGLEVRRDGVLLPSALLGSAVPVDPGSHDIVASAAGYKPFSKRIVARQRKTVTVTIPTLERAPEKIKKRVVAKKPVKRRVTEGRDTSTKPAKRGRGRRMGGATLAAAGLVLGGIGLVFGAQARSKWDEAFDDGHCTGTNVCNQTGFDLAEDARSKATLSTIFVGVGLAALGVGSYLYLTVPKGSKARVEASVGRNQAVIMVRGGF
jgi:hypothetical protein